VLKINYKITKNLRLKRRYTYCIINYINHDARYITIAARHGIEIF